MYAVVDIETTGGNASQGKVIEVAIVVHDGNEVVESFSSLVNPLRDIPPFISRLTGITNQMVENAPLFEEIAVRVHRMTEGKVFVAHNASFDYSFLKKEFSYLGIDFERQKICTVRLSRKLIPGQKRYNLGSICEHLGIEITDRHRALGDAEATAQLLTELIKRDPGKETVKPSLKRNSKKMTLPPHIARHVFEALPQQHGVYFLYDEQGKIAFIGKASNIKETVGQHFSGIIKTKGLLANDIHKVTFKETGNEFISLLLENESINKHFPKYNKTNKAPSLNIGLYQYTDQLGFTRIIIGKAGKRDKPFAAFGSEKEAIEYVREHVEIYDLCLRMCGLIKSNQVCEDEKRPCKVCQGTVEINAYNTNVETAFSGIGKNSTFVIKTMGRKENETGFVLVENGRFLGFGYIQSNTPIQSIEQLKFYLQPCRDTQEMQTIIKTHLKKSVLEQTKPFKVYELND